MPMVLSLSLVKFGSKVGLQPLQPRRSDRFDLTFRHSQRPTGLPEPQIGRVFDAPKLAMTLEYFSWRSLFPSSTRAASRRHQFERLRFPPYRTGETIFVDQTRNTHLRRRECLKCRLAFLMHAFQSSPGSVPRQPCDQNVICTLTSEGFCLAARSKASIDLSKG